MFALAAALSPTEVLAHIGSPCTPPAACCTGATPISATALWRKGSYGTQSDGGARFVERLLTVTATCKQHGRSVLDYRTTVCTVAQLGHPVPALCPVTA